MDSLEKYLPLLGRMAIAWLFVPAGWGKIGGGFAGTIGYIGSKGLPFPMVLAGIAIAIEVLAGLAVLVGYKTRWAAALLALFTIMAAVFFHNYWAVPAEQVMAQQINFNKNIAIFGGLMFLVAWGPGALSIDGDRRRAIVRMPGTATR